jgi:FeS assembly protein IscX
MSGPETEDLYWDSSYAIARRLRAAHPDVDLGVVTLNMLYNWVVALPDFRDDPQLANDELLNAIYQEWYEETHPL